MRTAAICPTCATYTNAVCVIYDGPGLNTLDIAPLTNLDEIVQKINAYFDTFEGTFQPLLGYVPENVANKVLNKTVFTGNSGSTTLYPSVKAVYDWATNTFELFANKSTNIVIDQGSNVKYPSVKAVYDWVTSNYISSASNGLTELLGDVQLGGILTKNTVIDGDGFTFTLNNSGDITLESVGAGSSAAFLTPVGTSLGYTSSAGVIVSGMNLSDALGPQEALLYTTNTVGGITSSVGVKFNTVTLTTAGVLKFVGVPLENTTTSLRVLTKNVATNDVKETSINSILSAITASNGLTKTVNDVKLGGTLVENTTIDADGFDFTLSNSNILLQNGVGAPTAASLSVSLNSVAAFYSSASGTINSSIILTDAPGPQSVEIKSIDSVSGDNSKIKVEVDAITLDATSVGVVKLLGVPLENTTTNLKVLTKDNITDEIKETDISSLAPTGWSGNIVVGAQTLTFTNGILTTVV